MRLDARALPQRAAGLVVAGLMILGLAACSSLDRLNPFASGEAKWPELPPLAGGLPLAPVWRVDLGEVGDLGYTPAVVGQTVFAIARAGTLARIEVGKTLWRVDGLGRLAGAVASDGRIVVVSTAQGEAIAHAAADGRELWRARLGAEVIAPPAIGEGKVFLRGNDGRLFALDASDGKRRWVYQRNLPPLTLRSAAGLTLADGRLYAGFPGGKLVALDAASGALLWEATVATPKGTTELERVADVVGNPLVGAHEVCAVAWQGRTACFDRRSGAPLWLREHASSVGGMLVGKQLVLVDDQGLVLALDVGNGASLWRQDLLRGRQPGRPLVVGEHLVVADGQGVLHVLRGAEGAAVGRYRLEAGGVTGVPVGLTFAQDPSRPASSALSGFVVQTRLSGLVAFRLP